MHFSCSACLRTYPLDGLDYACACGGLFSLVKGLGEAVPDSLSLGEVTTPILRRTLGQVTVNLKIDTMHPTGSFKDRGTRVMVNALKDLGVKRVVEDSSGNAGASFAGYCAAAGIACTIYVPKGTSPGKLKQLAAYKATVIEVPGSRDDTARATLEAAKTTYYASHVYNPLFFEGTKSLAYELARQVGVPDCVVVPAGNGTMLLGLYKGFSEMGKLPQLIAVQSCHCAPAHARFHGLPPGPVTPTVAEGIAVGEPKRIDEMVEAVRVSGGTFLTVEDDEVLTAQAMLGEMGIYVEATSGTAPAAAMRHFQGMNTDALNIVVPLTGSGLKK